MIKQRAILNKRQSTTTWLHQVSGNNATNLIESIVKNLTWVLNARQHGLNTSQTSYSTAPSYLLSYGMPDLSQFNPASDKDCQQLQNILCDVITRFEPRLTQVKVEHIKDHDYGPLACQYEITASVKSQHAANLHIFFDPIHRNGNLLSWFVEKD